METARRSCLFFLERLGAEIIRLHAEPFPGHHTGPKLWLDFALGAVDTAKGYLLEAAKPGKTPSEIEELVQNAELLGSNAYDWLTYVAGADARNIPHQVVAPFRRWVEGLGIKNTLFFRAEHLSNYELGTIDGSKIAGRISNPSKSFTDATQAISWPVQRVTVPSQSMALLPHFAVVAHELGHAIQDQINPNYAPFGQVNSDFFTRLQKRLTDNGHGFGNPEMLRCQKIADNWINEFKADAVAHVLVGPAFFFALSSFLELTGATYGIAPSHPPSDLRLAQLLDVLSAGGNGSFKSIIHSKLGFTLATDMTCPGLLSCPASDVLFAELRTKYGDLDAAICTELIEFFRAVAPAIFAATEAHLAQTAPTLVYSAAELSLDIDRHLDLLVTLVPPIEYQKDDATVAASLAAILNVGWAALLTKLQDMAEPRLSLASDPIAAKMERLHELLLKGVELSEARRLWEEHAP